MAVTIYLSLVFLALYVLGLAIRRWLLLRDRRTMAAESREGGRVIARVGDLAPGSVKKFWLIGTWLPPNGTTKPRRILFAHVTCSLIGW